MDKNNSINHVVKIFLLVYSLLAFSLEAQNQERPVNADSPVYSWLKWLYAKQGKTLPSHTGLYTEAEALFYLNLLDSSKFSEKDFELKTIIEKTLKPRLLSLEKDHESYLALAIEQQINLELYGGLGEKSTAWFYDYYQRPPLYQVIFQAWALERVYGAFDLELKKDPFVAIDQKQPISNILLDIAEIDFMFPYWAGIVVGGKHWDLRYFRSPVRWGSGDTDFIFTQEAGVIDHLMVSTWWENFKYTFFWAPSETYAVDTSKREYGYYNIIEEFQTNSYLKKSRHMRVHRFDVRFFDLVSLGLSEVSVFEIARFNLQYFNPFIPGHSWFLPYDQANHALVLDLDVALSPGFTLYGQLYADYIKTWWKNEQFNDPNPSAYGYLVGTRAVFELCQGLALVQTEFAWADPFLYKGRIVSLTNKTRFKSNYTGSQNRGTRLIERPYGFIPGADTIQANVKFRFEQLRQLAFEVQFPFQAKGEVSLFTPHPLEEIWNGNQWIESNNRPSATLSTPTGTPEFTQRFVVQAEVGPDLVPFPWDSSFIARLDHIMIFNQNHQSGKRTFAFQAVLTWKNVF